MNEATVRRPPRSKKWVAVYTGEEAGQQVARSTGLTSKMAALALARAWEKDARKKRMAKPSVVTKPRPVATLTQAEVAALLGMSERGVRAVERRALRKLRAHPELQKLWREHAVDETRKRKLEPVLTPEEVHALHSLAVTDVEKGAIYKAIRITLG